MLHRFVVAMLCTSLALTGCAASDATPNGATSDRAAEIGAVVSHEFIVVPTAKRQAFPIWSGRTLAGAAWSTTALGGRVSVVNFWASWCYPCTEEWPELQQAAAVNPAVPFIGVNTWDKVPDAAAFAKEAGARYPLVFDDQGVLIGALTGVPNDSLPMTLVIDTAGRVAAWRTGATTAAALQRAIDAVQS